MKRIFFIALSLLSVSAFAQNKMLSMEDAVFNPALSPENLKEVKFITGTDFYSYIGKKNNIECIIISSANSKNDTVLFAEEFESGKKSFPVFEWMNKNEFVYHQGSNYRKYSLSDKNSSLLIDYKDGAENKDLSPDKKTIAYTIDQNLYISSYDKNTQITNETNKDILSGQAVHRNELGIKKGIFWSPSSAKIAFYKMDQSMVTDYPLVDINSSPAKLNNIKYPMAGQVSHEVKIGVYDLNSGKTVFLEIEGAKDQYLSSVTWGNDSKSIYVAVVGRNYKESKLNQYNADNGKFIKTLFIEKEEKYVEPSDEMQFLSNGNFIWHSERDGYKHLYLFDPNGKLIRQLTKGNWVITSFLGFDNKQSLAYYMSTEESPLERNLYSVDLKSGKRKRLSSENGMHTIVFSSDKNLFIDTYSNTKTPRIINLNNSSGSTIKNLLKSKNPLTDYALGEMSIFTIKAADNVTDLYCRVFKPANFDPSKKYPAVVYLYGGPHLQLINNSWLGGSNLWFQLMAQKGYVVFSVDSRGSMYRGKAFEQSTHRNLGKVEMQDQIRGAEYLKSLPYVDGERMGIHGWSYGGFMTTTIMTKSPDLFKAGVAGGPVIDWSLYEIMYTERYMDTPQENPEGYRESNLLNYADQLKGRLMMIHGTVDDVVVWQHSQAFLKKCVEKGILLDYFVYPGHAHNVRGKDRIHLMNTITRYFEDHLK